MNTILTFGLLLVVLIAAIVVFIDTDVPRWWIAAGGVGVALVVPPLIDPFTRTLWTAIDVGMRPLQAHEVDWTVVAPDAPGNTADRPGLRSSGPNPTGPTPPPQDPKTEGTDS